MICFFADLKTKDSTKKNPFALFTFAAEPLLPSVASDLIHHPWVPSWDDFLAGGALGYYSKMPYYTAPYQFRPYPVRRLGEGNFQSQFVKN